MGERSSDTPGTWSARGVQRLRGFARSRFSETIGLLAFVFGLIALFALTSPNNAFLSVANLRNIALDTAELLVLASGMTLVIISGNIDLSVGSQVIFNSVVFAKVLTAVLGTGAVGLVVGVLIAVACAAAAGGVWGALNGVLSGYFRIPSFVVTLGTMSIALGSAQIITGGFNIPSIPLSLQREYGLGSLGGMPYLVLTAAVVCVVLGFILAKTRFGLRIYALGANREAVRRAGISTGRQAVLIFGLMGMLCGVVALMDVARFNTTSIGAHTMDALNAVSAVIIGGTSLFGGKGRMSGTIIGAFIPGILRNGLILIGLKSFWQNVAIGMVLIGAVAIDQFRRRRGVE